MDLNYLLPPLISSILAGILLVIVLIKGRKRATSVTFSFAVFVTLLLGLFVFFMRSSPDAEHALPWDRAAVVAGTAVFLSFYYFALSLTRAKKNRVILLTSFIALALVIALSPTSVFIQAMRVESYGYAPIVGSGVYFLVILALLLAGMTFYQLIKAYRASKEYEERNRYLFMTLAMSLPLVGLLLDAVPSIYPAGILSNIAFCLFASVAIFRYHLFDVRLVARRSLAYIITGSLVAAPYVLIILLASKAFAPNEVPIWVHAVLLLLLAFTVQPVWRRVQRLTDRLFYLKRYDYLKMLERFSRECTGIIDLDKLCEHLFSLTLPAMGATRACLMTPHSSERKFVLVASSTPDIKDDVTLDADSAVVTWLEHYQRPLRHSDLDFTSSLASVTAREKTLMAGIGADILVPLNHGDRLNGILMLGPKASEEPYGPDDIATLMVLANHASTAIANAQLFAQSQQLARIDELTGLYNRRHLYEVLDSEVHRAQRYSKSFSVIMLDLDGFKEYNDTFGHINGDIILQSISRVIKTSLRKSDFPFRYGGDEFVIILPETDAENAKRVIERVRSKWLRVPEALYPLLKTPLGFSAAIAQFPKHAETADGLIFMVDTALSYAKSKGGYRTVLASNLETVPREVLSMATQDQVTALAATVDAKDPYTYGHSRNVATVAKKIGETIGLSSKELADLYAVAILHDIGKLGIPDSILTKPGKLTEEEWKIVKKHSSEGERIVGYVKDLSSLAHMIRHHHEWYDGRGYPDGFKEEQIPLGSRIISVADAYDTMVSDRPYRKAMSHEEACEELKRCAGTQFDPKLVESFSRSIEKDSK